MAAAAILGEIADHRIDPLQFGMTAHESSFLRRIDQAGVRQSFDVERQGGCRQFEMFGNDADGHAIGRVLHQQAENGQAAFLRQCGEDGYGFQIGHVSNNTEITFYSQSFL